MLNKNNYIPFIDGLRAIAVVSVILYHLNIFNLNILPGGYLGVDIFFVISGYLISKIIMKELLSNKSFDFKNFYMRRARRILPILLIVSLFYLITFNFIPVDYNTLHKSILSSLFFFSNYYYFFITYEYGAPNNFFIPFLHTWSLGIEEQFYIFAPLGFILSFKLKLKFINFILIIVISSFLFMLISNENNPLFTFYSIHTRAWEIGLGSMIAYIKLYKKINYKNYFRYLPAVGFAMILFSFVYFDRSLIDHPSHLTFIPVLGVLIILLFNNEKNLINHIFANKIFVKIGLLSYSIYLWHYPTFIYINFLPFSNLFFKVFIGLITTFIFSVLFYKLVEQPMRNKVKISDKFFFKAISILILLVILIIFFISKNNQIFIKKEDEEIKRQLIYNNEYCSYFPNDNLCEDISDKKILVVSDSMVHDIANILWLSFPAKYEYNSSPGCPPMLENETEKFLTKNHPNLQGCKELNKIRFNTKSINYDEYFGVAIFVRYGGYTPEMLESYLMFLKSQGVKKCLIIGDYLAINGGLDKILNKFKNIEKTKSYLTKNPDLVLYKENIDNRFKDIVNKYDYNFLSLRENVCVNNNCPVFFNNFPFTFDEHHFTFEFSKFLSEIKKYEINQWISE